MSSFPLLRLPQLVLCDVINSLSIGEKIKLSFCSKKVCNQVKNARLYSQKVIVDLDTLYQATIKVFSENNNDTFEILIRFNNGICNNPNSIKIEEHTVSVVTFSKAIKTFWINYSEGFLSVIRYLLKIFRCKFSTDSGYFNIVQQPTFSELLNLQLEFTKLTIYLYGSKGDNLLWNQISSNFGLVEDLRIISVGNLGFRPVFASWPQKISITGSASFTLKSLLTCSCTRITLGGSLLENKDVDEILRKWKAGGFPNLEYLYVESHNIAKYGTTILGMHLSQLRGMVIQNDDGSKKATINTRGNRIEMSVTPFE